MSDQAERERSQRQQWDLWNGGSSGVERIADDAEETAERAMVFSLGTRRWKGKGTLSGGDVGVIARKVVVNGAFPTSDASHFRSPTFSPAHGKMV